MYTDLLRNPKSNTTGGGHQLTPVLSKVDHPRINYWTRDDWTSHKANIQQAGITTNDDEPGILDFVESVDGIPVSPEKIAAVRRSSRELFFSLQVMYANNKRPAPGSWGATSYGDKEFYREKMKEQYPELTLCEADWKVEFVATQTYPGWYRNHGKPKVKKEPGANRRSKTMAGSSTSSTPAPNDTPGHIPPTNTTLDTGVSSIAPTLDLGLEPSDPGSPTLQEVDRRDPSQEPDSTQDPVFSRKSSLSQAQGPVSPTTTPSSTPPTPTNTPFDANNQSLGATPDPDAEVATPATIGPLERETTPSASIQVCHLLLSSTALH